MKIKIDDIKISARIRQEHPKVEELKQSIQEVGLLNPVIVNEENELLSGFRRLTACRELGWDEIEAIQIRTGDDELKKLDIEYHENVGRADLTITDKYQYEQMRHDILNPPRTKGFVGMLKRFWEFIKSFFSRKRDE